MVSNGHSNQARNWLKRNGYEDVADTIDDILADFKKRKVKTRRNWWDILAGTKNGKGHIVNGRLFPVLASARERKGYPPTEGAIKASKETEQIPEPQVTARWHPELRVRKN